MDAIDGQLLARLVQDPLASTSALGRVVGLTRNAVKARLERLQDAGVLGGFIGVPNPSLFGRTGLVCVHDQTPRPNPPLDEVLAVDPVVLVTVNHDDVLAAIVHLEDVDAGPPAALAELMGAPPTRTFQQRNEPLAPPGTVLSGPEWRVIEAMVQHPRQTIRELAERTGLTTKAVTRHRKRLIDGNHIKVQPVILEAGGGRQSFYEIYVQGAIAHEPHRLTPVTGQNWVIERLDEPLGVLVLCLTSSVGGAVAALNKVRQLDGVEHAELIMSKEWAWAPERIEAWCRDAREAWARVRADARDGI